MQAEDDDSEEDGDDDADDSAGDDVTRVMLVVEKTRNAYEPTGRKGKKRMF